MAARMMLCPGCGSVQREGATCGLCGCPVTMEMKDKIRKERENKSKDKSIQK